MAALSVGRIDTPFLAPGVGVVAGVELDSYPTVHMREVMSHEAHKHPYMESLGTIYLMKLRHGKSFCTHAGSCWRLIFVYALMPWMQKYRIFENKSEREEDPNPPSANGKMHGSKIASVELSGMSRSFTKAPRMLAKSVRANNPQEIMIRKLLAQVKDLEFALAEAELKLAAKQEKEANATTAAVATDGSGSTRMFL